MGIITVDVSDKDSKLYGRVLTHTTLYKMLYGCDNLDSRLDFLEKASHDGSPEVFKWLGEVHRHATEIQLEACDFGNTEQLRKDEESLEKTEDFLSCQSDLLPCQVYSVRDLALRLRHAGKL